MPEFIKKTSDHLFGSDSCAIDWLGRERSPQSSSTKVAWNVKSMFRHLNLATRCLLHSAHPFLSFSISFLSFYSFHPFLLSSEINQKVKKIIKWRKDTKKISAVLYHSYSIWPFSSRGSSVSLVRATKTVMFFRLMSKNFLYWCNFHFRSTIINTISLPQVIILDCIFICQLLYLYERSRTINRDGVLCELHLLQINSMFLKQICFCPHFAIYYCLELVDLFQNLIVQLKFIYSENVHWSNLFSNVGDTCIFEFASGLNFSEDWKLIQKQTETIHNWNDLILTIFPRTGPPWRIDCIRRPDKYWWWHIICCSGTLVIFRITTRQYTIWSTL